MEQLADVVPMVQILDIPVPQMVEQLLEVFWRLDIEVPEQVIEVPKISQDSIRERLVDCDLRHPQMAEQLVEGRPSCLSPRSSSSRPSRSSTIQLFVVVVVVEVLEVFSQERVQQRLPTLTFQFLGSSRFPPWPGFNCLIFSLSWCCG